MCVNEKMEDAELSQKDELKQRREAGSQEQALSVWRCSEQQECYFAGLNKTGVVNIRLQHGRVALCQQRYPHCGKLHLKPSLIMHVHVRYCKNNPAWRPV